MNVRTHYFFRPNLAYFLIRSREDPQALAEYNNKRIAWEKELVRLLAIEELKDVA